jgi:hypothetical protein
MALIPRNLYPPLLSGDVNQTANPDLLLAPLQPRDILTNLELFIWQGPSSLSWRALTGFGSPPSYIRSLAPASQSQAFIKSSRRNPESRQVRQLIGRAAVFAGS